MSWFCWDRIPDQLWSPGCSQLPVSQELNLGGAESRAAAPVGTGGSHPTNITVSIKREVC